MSQNGLMYFISSIEKKINLNKNETNNFFLKVFKKLLLRLCFFINFPNYKIPIYNLRDKVVLARDPFQIHLNKTDRTSVYNTEISKILLKIELIFSSSQQILFHELIKLLANEKSKLCKYQYISMFMPIVHLSHDLLEKVEIKENGSFHTDRDHQFGYKGSKILWLPFTDYEYEGIVTKKWLVRNFFHILGPRFGFSKLVKYKNKSLKDTHIGGDFISWSDVFPHGGMRNNTSKDAIALIVRFSKKYTKQTFIPLKSASSDEFINLDQKKRKGWDIILNYCKTFIYNILLELKNKKVTNNLIQNNLHTFLTKIEKENNKLNIIDFKLIILHILLYGVETMEQRLKAFSFILQDNISSGDEINNIIKKCYYLKNLIVKLQLS